MSYYREDDPRNLIIFQMMSDIQDMLNNVMVLIDEYACDIDDGYHWVRQKIEVEE